MIKIALFSTRELLDLPEDFKICFERFNPILCVDGSGSLLLKLPGTPNNIRLLGLLGHPCMTAMPTSSVEVLVNIAGLELFARLEILTSSDKEICSALMFNESLFYCQLGAQTTLKEVFEGVKFGTGNPIETPTVPLQESLAYKLQNSLPPELVLATIRGREYYEVKGTDSKEYYELTKEIMKGPKQYTVDGAAVTADPLFRTSVHIKVRYVAEKIFARCGFDVDLSVLDLLADDRLIVVNNVQDLCVTGYIYYKDLVPSCTASEFLYAIRRAFNVEFFYDWTGNKFVLRKFDEFSGYHLDVSDKLLTNPIVRYDTKRRLNLTGSLVEVSKINPKSETAPVSNYEPKLNGCAAYEKIETGLTFPGIDVDYGGQDYTVIESLQRLHTDLTVNGELREDKSDADMPIIFAYDNGRILPFGVVKQSGIVTSGGNFYDKPYIPLVPNKSIYGKAGLASLYEYRESLAENTMPECTVNLILPLVDFFTLDLMRPLLVMGARFAIKGLKASIIHNGISATEATLLLLREKPYYQS